MRAKPWPSPGPPDPPDLQYMTRVELAHPLAHGRKHPCKLTHS